MRRIFVLLGTGLLMSMMFLPTATAQEARGQGTGAIAAPAEGPPPSEYQVTKNGTLIVGGDVFLDCGSVGSDDIPPTATPSARAEINQTIQEQAAICQASGFPTPEVGFTQARLPDTGGPPTLVWSALLIASGILTLAMVRNKLNRR